MTEPIQTVNSSNEENSENKYSFIQKGNLWLEDTHNYNTSDNKHIEQHNAERELMGYRKISICQPFPNTIDEFKGIRDQYKKYKERYYEFSSGPTSNKFLVSILTLDMLIESNDRCLKQIDLSTRQADLSNSKEENRNNVQLKNALDHNRIEYIESTYTTNIFVRNCDWNTLCKISNLVNELKCDLTVSGGGYGGYENAGPAVSAKKITGRIKSTITYRGNLSDMVNSDMKVRNEVVAHKLPNLTQKNRLDQLK